MEFIVLWILMLVLGLAAIGLQACFDSEFDWLGNLFYLIACWIVIGALLIVPATWAAACPDCPL